MTMTEFADQLFTELMAEYRPTLEKTELAQPRAKRSTRPVWLTSGLATLGALLTTVLLLVTSGGPAYAVTRNPDGTITVTLNQLAALTQAAAALNTLGTPTAFGCPWHEAGFPDPVSNSVTINPRTIPPGNAFAVVAAARQYGPPQISMVILSSPAAGCAALDAALANARKAGGQGKPIIIHNGTLEPMPPSGGK